MMYRLTEIQRVHMYSDPDNWCAEVSVADLGGDELVAVFAQNRGLRHTDTGTILLIRSLDGGKTWPAESKVVVLPQEDAAGWNIAGICRLSDGTLLVHAIKWEFLSNGEIDVSSGISENDGVWLTRSTDSGHTWSTPRRINMAPMRNALGRDAILELPDSRLLLPLGGSRLERKTVGIPERTGEPIRSYVLSSDDRGQTWHYWGTMAYDPADIISFHEPGLVRLPDGRLLGLMRTQRWPSPAGPTEQYAPPSGYIFSVLSEDDGVSWSWPRNILLWGYPTDPILLEDGAVLAAYSHRREPWGVRVAVSSDGETWRPEDVFRLADYDMAGVRPAVPTWTGEPPDLMLQHTRHHFHIGYPSSVLRPDGSVFTAYHLFNPQGRQYIEGALYRVARA